MSFNLDFNHSGLNLGSLPSAMVKSSKDIDFLICRVLHFHHLLPFWINPYCWPSGQSSYLSSPVIGSFMRISLLVLPKNSKGPLFSSSSSSHHLRHFNGQCCQVKVNLLCVNLSYLSLLGLATTTGLIVQRSSISQPPVNKSLKQQLQHPPATNYRTF